jgi:hypothetical protein
MNVQHRHPYAMGYAHFLDSHFKEIDKGRQGPPAPADGDEPGGNNRGRSDKGAAGKSGLDGDVLAALEQRWIRTDDREKRAWQTRAEQMHQAAAAAATTSAATASAGSQGKGGDPSPVSTAAAVAAAAAAARTGVDFGEGGDDVDDAEAEEEDDDEDDDDDDDDDDDNLEPLDAAEGDDDWADRKRPATKKPNVPV